MKRRSFIKSSFAASPVIVSGIRHSEETTFNSKRNLKLSLNAYSFNEKLRSGETNLFELIDYCHDNGFDAIDPTGYYFQGYPEVPDDSYINEFKRKAFLAGIEVSGTGVRNDFANADAQSLVGDLKLIESWCLIASKLGAPLLRVFPGKELNDGRDKKKVMQQVINELKKACVISEKYGIMLALQNHNDFLKSSQEISQIMDGVNSSWLGLHLDIGSLAFTDPYQEIEKLIKYAITWQIKQFVWLNNTKVPLDYDRLMDIIHRSDYVGYLPLETLQGDPIKKLPVMVEEMRKRL